jgi:hypothetical protein
VDWVKEVGQWTLECVFRSKATTHSAAKATSDSV